MTSLMTWLVPAVGPERDDLVATMDRLAAQHDAARFEPHVTLVPNVESGAEAAAATLTSLAAAMTPIEVNFASLGLEDTYFRALYLVPQPHDRLHQHRLTADDSFRRHRAVGSDPRSARLVPRGEDFVHGVNLSGQRVAEPKARQTHSSLAGGSGRR